jgi:alkylation response protein AidB-like acyl-CoA dehydrogenase
MPIALSQARLAAAPRGSRMVPRESDEVLAKDTSTQPGRSKVARVDAVTAVHRGAEVVRAAYDAAGAGVVRRSGVLQRLLRDASCLTHHISANALSLRADRSRALRDRPAELPDLN